jgi:mutator protein MutT
MSKYTHTLLFLLNDQQILLAIKKKHGLGTGRWNGVGGKIEKNETLQQAAIRETQEEIDVTPINVKMVAGLNFREFHEGKEKHLNVAVFFCDKWQGEPSESDEMKPQWFDRRLIPFDKMWPDDQHWLPLVLNNRLVKASFEIDENNKIASFGIRQTNEKELLEEAGQ